MSESINDLIYNLVQLLERNLVAEDEDTWEIIVVDDGSSDATSTKILEIANSEKRIKLIKQPHQMGEAASLMIGMLYSHGSYIAYMKTNGYYNILDLCNFFKAIRKSAEITSKFILNGDRLQISINSSSLWDRIMVFFTDRLKINQGSDIESGFKLFSRKAAQKIIPNLTSSQTCPEIEIITLACRSKINAAVFDVPISVTKIESDNHHIQTLIHLLILCLVRKYGMWKLKYYPKLGDHTNYYQEL